MLNIFYNDKQAIDADSYSPSPKKPSQVVTEWGVKYSEYIKLCDFDPVTEDMLLRVHSSDYVTGVLAGTRINGFGNTRLDVAESLLYTSGSMVAAAKCALKEGVAVSPTSGFHHACFNGGGGFCTFNGLMVAAYELYKLRLVRKVGIIDCDYHYGNGTDDIIKRLGTSFIEHFTAGRSYNGVTEDDYATFSLDFYSSYSDSNDVVASKFLNNLPRILDRFKNCDIILYQAGADPHVKDPLGGFLTDDQLRARDAMVFLAAKKMGVPIAWNLAGGYQKPLQKVLNIHNATLEECLKVYG